MKVDDILKELSESLQAALPGYLKEQRWFRSKARTITGIRLEDVASVSGEPPFYFMALVRAEYDDGGSEVYYIPLAVNPHKESDGIDPSKLISSVHIGSGTGDVYEATENEPFNRIALDAIEASAVIKSRAGSFVFGHTDLFSSATIPAGSIKKIAAEQSNTSIVFGEALIMKNYRKIEEGTNPDFDLSYFLTTRTDFRNFPALHGYIEYRKAEGEEATIGMLQNYIGDADDCWEWTCGHLRGLYAFLGGLGHQKVPKRDDTIRAFSSEYLDQIEELGRTTARFHIALASDHKLAPFAPEAITAEDIAKWQYLLSSQIRSVMKLVVEKMPSFPESAKRELSFITVHEGALLQKVKGLRCLKDEGVRKIRIHGDYHLGQVLRRGDTFFILDFEGEPARPLTERKAKNCALKDIAGILRSFDYAAYAVLFELPQKKMDKLEEWGMTWRDLARRSFLSGYFDETAAKEVRFLPASSETLNKILSAYEMDKAIYELNYELNNRPNWLRIPIRGLLSIASQ